MQFNDGGVRILAGGHAKQILDAQEWIFDQLGGDKIRQRWKKMGKQKRQQCLLQADPTMFRCDWAEVRLIFGGEGADLTIAQRHDFRNICLAPQFNLEELTKTPSRKVLESLISPSQQLPRGMGTPR